MTYALGGFAYKGLALISVPLIARLLSPAELGLLDFAAVVAAVVGLAVAVGSEQGVAYLDASGTPADRVWESTLAMIGGLAVVVVMGAVILNEFVARLVTGDPANGPLIVVATLYGGVIAVTSVALNVMRLRASPRSYAVVSFLVVAAEMTGAVAIALLVESPVVLMVVAWAAGAAFVAAGVLVRYLPRLGAPRLRTVRRLVAYGTPLIPATMAWLLGDAWIRASLAHAGDLVALGEYGIAYRVASVLALAVGGFGVAWHPYLYRTNAGAVVPRAARVLPFAVLGLGCVAVVLTALAPEIVLVLGGAPYAGATAAVAALAGGMVAFGAFVLISAVVGSFGSTRAVGIAAVAGAAVQVVAAMILISGLGLVGAALASLAGYVFGAVILLAARRHVLAGHTGLRSLAAMALAGVTLVLAHGALEWVMISRLFFAAGSVVVFAGGAVTIRWLERLRLERGGAGR